MIRTLVLLCFVISQPVAAETLRSPWPTRLVGQNTNLACAQAPALPRSLDVEDYYSDKSHSVIDPDQLRTYQATIAPLHAATAALERMADKGDDLCAAQWLTTFAAQGVLTGSMATNQAEYVRGWMLGAWATVALKVTPSRASAQVASWLAVLATDVQSYLDNRAGRVDARNNHRNWAGFAVAAAGVATDRVDLFAWGMKSARAGLRQVQADGSLPLEMERKSRALHYHLFATAPLVLAAELAASNGQDLYAAPDADGRPGALQRLVVRSLSGLDDTSFFAKRAGAAQVDAGGDRPGNVEWVSTFLARSPGAAPRPAAAGQSDLYSGGLPPMPVLRPRQ